MDVKIVTILKMIYNLEGVKERLEKMILDTDNDLDNGLYKIIDILLRNEI